MADARGARYASLPFSTDCCRVGGSSEVPRAAPARRGSGAAFMSSWFGVGPRRLDSGVRGQSYSSKHARGAGITADPARPPRLLSFRVVTVLRERYRPPQAVKPGQRPGGLDLAALMQNNMPYDGLCSVRIPLHAATAHQF